MIIRSHFGRRWIPFLGLAALPGYFSTQRLQPVVAFFRTADSLMDGVLISDEQVIAAGFIDLR